MATIQVPENTGSFLINCIQFYEEMLNDIKLCKRKGLDKQAEIECCFEIATNYVGRLAMDVKDYEFENIKEEVFFFKKLKPLFTAEAEFYTYHYHAELFKNNVESDCQTELELFYHRQLQRMTKFSREQPVFFVYMLGEKTENDHLWFTRKPGESAVCPYDKLMATFEAIKKYEEFVATELKSTDKEIKIHEPPSS